MSIIERALNKAKDERQKSGNSTDSPNEIENNLSNQDSCSLSTSASTTELMGASGKEERSNGAKEIEYIDWEALAELGFVTPASNTNTQAVEEYRNIKRPLINNAFGIGSVGINRSNLILITSSIPGEGKTFTAINLALSIANERDKKVLLIDADVARPSVSKTLGIKSSPGLIEYLEGQNVEFSDIVLKTNMPGLSVIPAGKQHKHSTELLTSNRMILLAQELSNRYPDRMVIFDSPPLLAATQGEVLAGLVGQVILVVEAEKTPQSMIMASVNKLVFCDVVLVLLNKTQKNVDANHYGYGLYGY
ncbi:MAG: XrtA-associated tyrosine autokinase [Methylobacter sp.]|nr:XrtA-associated tyrosine autokinase [Methylobacter sp.]